MELTLRKKKNKKYETKKNPEERINSAICCITLNE